MLRMAFMRAMRPGRTAGDILLIRFTDIKTCDERDAIEERGRESLERYR
jgi:hypothetical protein